MIKLRNILNEGRYDEVVTVTARKVFDAIKNGKKSYQEDLDLSGYRGIAKKDTETDLKFLMDILVEIDLVIKYNKKIPWSHNINAEADQVKKSDEYASLEGTITVNPNFLPMAYNDILAEIKEMLRHEIEHIAQGKKGKLRYQKHGEIPFIKYVLLRHEVPAYVQGLYKRAKTKRITVPQAMEEWYSENKHNFSSPDEWTKVKKVWMDWGKQNLPNAQWEEQ